LNKDAKKCSKIRVISIANIIAECITRLSNEESLSEMFL
ncbi:MAG: ribose-phosphate pyrophosphokinase, partial [Pelagibacteraceae bacterium]|nr:ribose-phosphate pyrophosphokinase [Pelagibacteraceae bacterium]